MIVVEDFHKKYGSTVAVDGISFRVDAGQVLGLVGPNGAGKTTTLRTITGVASPSRGRITVAGYDLQAEPIQVKSRLAYVPDDPQLFESLTVNEHLEFIAAAYRVRDYRGRADDLLDYFELTAKKYTPAEELSRGMRQKLAICCAYLHEPAAILFDEPLTGLDPRAIRKLKDSIVDRSRSGSAIIMSSHLLAMVDDICTHYLILDRGRTRFSGPRSRLHSSFAPAGNSVSLEDIFFLVTGDDGTAASDGATVPPISCAVR